MNEQVHRGFRAMVYVARAIRSSVTLAYYRCLYSGLIVGRRVSVGRGVHIRVNRGSTLRIGDDVRLDSHSQLISEGNLTIGRNSYVGVGAIVVAKENIQVGNDALIAAYATIRDHDHGLGSLGEPYHRQGSISSPILIGDNVWLGTKSTILRGVQIGNNAVIGANAVVTRSLEANVIAAGIPARVIKQIGDSGSNDAQQP